MKNIKYFFWIVNLLYYWKTYGVNILIMYCHEVIKFKKNLSTVLVVFMIPKLWNVLTVKKRLLII